MLGAILAILSAASFALNNAAARRGVVTGTPRQGMAVSIPVGVLCFIPAALVAGELVRLGQFPPVAAAWMAGVGLVHFVVGRYCNYSANQAAGVNLTAPVVQLQVVVTLVLAVVILREPCTLLQAIGGVMIVAGSLVTQRQPTRTAGAVSAAAATRPVFQPRHLAGYLFASGAALAYGSSPIMARFALADSGPTSGILGGLIAYGAATIVVVLALLAPPVQREVMALRRDNARWFVVSGIFVAMAQGFFFAAVAVAPVLLVMPLLQTSLIFRLLFSTWLSPDHEVFGWLVLAGVAVSISGALLVSIDTEIILNALSVPGAIAEALRWRVW